MKRVLIADDEASLRLLVRATIASPEYVISEAADGDAAWEMVQRECPDLVLLDIQMPGRSGLEVVRAIRRDPAHQHMIIILLSAQAQAVDLEKGRAAGADHYLTKPFSTGELLTLVEQVLVSADPLPWPNRDDAVSSSMQ